MGQIYRMLNAGAVLAEKLDNLADLRRRFTVAGAPTMSASPFGQALMLDGVSDYLITVGREESLDFDAQTDPMSICCWLYLDAAVGTQVIATKTVAGFPFNGWEFNVAHGNDIHIIFSESVVGPSQISVESDPGLTAETWQHVAMTYDGGGAAAGVTMYIDGDPSADVNTDALGGSSSSAVNVAIGATLGGGSPVGGRMRDLMIFRHELTIAEVLGLAKNRSF